MMWVRILIPLWNFFPKVVLNCIIFFNFVRSSALYFGVLGGFGDKKCLKPTQ